MWTAGSAAAAFGAELGVIEPGVATAASQQLLVGAALDDAAAMIDERRLPEGLVPDDGAMPPAAAPRETGGPEPMELPQ